MSIESTDRRKGISCPSPLALRSSPWAQATGDDSFWTGHEGSGWVECPRVDERRGS